MSASLGSETLRIARRGSALSVAQAELVATLLRQRWPELRIEWLDVVTRGDQDQQTPLAQLESPDGIFTRGVETELLANRADVAVHSLKDLPTLGDPALVLAALPRRADPRDALVSRHSGGFAALPPGARLGTSSPRRAAQALALRPDLQIGSVRGNVDTRLRKLRAAEVDAMILAAAGLDRLGLLDVAAELLPVEEFVPAVGQGALAVQCRADDQRTRALLAPIDDPATRAAVTAERALLRSLGGGCRLPIAAYAEVQADRLLLRAFVGAPDGSATHSATLEAPAADPVAAGESLAARIRSEVPPTLLEEARAIP